MIAGVEKLLPQIHLHAKRELPRECCGLIVVWRGKLRYAPCRNTSVNEGQFAIEPEDWVRAEELGKVVAVVHSHPYMSPEPSGADLVGIENTKLPWLIVNFPVGHYTWNEPRNYEMPLVGREFVHGVVDCYSLIRDYYKQKLGIRLSDYERPDNWWSGECTLDLYRDNYAKEGFYEVRDRLLQPHDFLIIQVASAKPNHGAIYVGNNEILHHMMDRLSSKDIYDEYWRRRTVLHLRHEDVK